MVVLEEAAAAEMAAATEVGSLVAAGCVVAEVDEPVAVVEGSDASP